MQIEKIKRKNSFIICFWQIFTKERSTALLKSSLRSDGKSLIALFTGKRYPVYLLHWHPAKSQFEWRRDMDINHSLADVVSGQYFANFLIQKGELENRFSFSSLTKNSHNRWQIIFIMIFQWYYCYNDPLTEKKSQ